MTAVLTVLDSRPTDHEHRFDGVVRPGIRDTGEAFEVVVDGRVLATARYVPTPYGISKAKARRWAEGVCVGHVLAQKDAAA